MLAFDQSVRTTAVLFCCAVLAQEAWHQHYQFDGVGHMPGKTVFSLSCPGVANL